MSDKCIDFFLYAFSIITIGLPLLKLIMLCFNKNSKVIEMRIEVFIVITGLLAFGFGYLSNNRTDFAHERSIKRQDSIIISQRIELEKEKQKTQLIIDENISFKKYRINLMNASIYGTYYILLDSTNHYSGLNQLLPNNYYGNSFLSKFSFNTTVLSNRNTKFYLSPTVEQYFDIFEISFFEWYESMYYSNWYVVDQQYSTFGGSASSPKNLNKTSISIETISKGLKKNKALPFLKIHNRIIMPPNTILNIVQTRYGSTDNYFETTIIINNTYFTITINLYYKNLLELNDKYYIGQLDLEKYINVDDKIKTLEFSVFAGLKVKENILFDEKSAKQIYWANQLLDNIEKTFKH